MLDCLRFSRMTNSMNAAWWVKRWSELHPQKPAIIFEDETITYSSLYNKINAVAAWLESVGVKKGDRVAVMLRNSPEFLELYLGCTLIGAIFVPLNFRFVSKEVEYTLNNCTPKLFVYERELLVEAIDLESLLISPRLVVVDKDTGPKGALDYAREVAKFSGKDPGFNSSPPPLDPEEPHVIMYTSGTTGEPKGAVLSHRKTFFNCLNAEMFFNMGFHDVMLIILPLFHSGGLFIQASPSLYKGITMVIHSRFDPQKTYTDIARYGVTKFLGVPTIYKSLLHLADEHKRDMSSLKVCAIGGEKTTHDLIVQCSRAGFPVRQIMGQTETSILLWASEKESLERPGTVGRPVFHAEVGLVDVSGRSVAPGEVGEIVVRGSIMMTEYWNDPVRTRETIRDGWLYTGDLARMDEDGYFYLVDRAKDMYISGGENVYPAEVERIIREHPGVEDVAVVGVPDEKWGEVGHAFVIRKKGCKVSEQDILAFCNGKLARYKLPKKFSFVSSLPRTMLGKVKKHLLKQMLEGLNDFEGQRRKGVRESSWGGVMSWESNINEEKEAVS